MWCFEIMPTDYVFKLQQFLWILILFSAFHPFYMRTCMLFLEALSQVYHALYLNSYSQIWKLCFSCRCCMHPPLMHLCLPCVLLSKLSLSEHCMLNNAIVLEQGSLMSWLREVSDMHPWSLSSYFAPCTVMLVFRCTFSSLSAHKWMIWAYLWFCRLKGSLCLGCTISLSFFFFCSVPILHHQRQEAKMKWKTKSSAVDLIPPWRLHLIVIMHCNYQVC